MLVKALTDSLRDATRDGPPISQTNTTRPKWAFSVSILDYEEVDDYDIQVSDSPF